MTLRAHRLLIVLVAIPLLARWFLPSPRAAYEPTMYCREWRENSRGEVGCASDFTEPTRPLSLPHRLALGMPIDLNRATATDLVLIDGVGPALAARIVANRPYQSVAELERVSGIGPVRMAGLRRFFEVK